MYKLMKKAKLTPIIEGIGLSPFTIDLEQSPDLIFWFDKGFTEISSPGLRFDRVRIKEGLSDLIKMLDKKPVSLKLRTTTEIITEGNTDFKNRL